MIAKPEPTMVEFSFDSNRQCPMNKKFTSLIKSCFSFLLVGVLALGIAFGPADGALAARSGGRIGGGSFRAPTSSRPYSAPSRGPSGGYYPAYPGGGFGFPFLFPFFGIGGGGLFTILIGLAIANFLIQSLRRAGNQDGLESGYNTEQVAIARVQVGLLANARNLQADLNRIAETADTNSPAGLAQVLQETTLSLLRHPEYWVYASGAAEQSRLEAAETQFNRLALAERSKFSEETLSNFNSQRQLKQATSSALVGVDDTGTLVNSMESTPGEYIVATILVGAQGQLQLPAINSTEDLRRALSQIGAVPAERLMAVEILWSPQATGDTLSADDLLTEYPDLKLI